MRKPNCFLVGAAKSGTSSLYQYLKQHPQIYFPDIKEPHFFSTDVIPPYAVRGLDNYLALYDPVGDEKIIGDASASYLYSEVAAAKIHDFCLQAKIIISLRNPVDMMHSLHSQSLASMVEDIPDFEEALKAEPVRMADPEASKIVFYQYRAAATYTPQVERFLQVFGRENVHLIIFDDLVSSPNDVYQQILKFLDVDTSFEPEVVKYNVNKIMRSQALARKVKKIRPAKGQEKKQPLRMMAYSVLYALNTKREVRKPLDPVLKKRLRLEFRPDVDRLSTLIDRDLMHWVEIED